MQTRFTGTPLSQTFLTSAYANQDDADAVRAVHRDYLDAGADVLTANNFALTVGSQPICPVLSSTHVTHMSYATHTSQCTMH